MKKFISTGDFYRKHTVPVLLMGIAVLSWSSILIRWLAPLSPFTIAFYRITVSGIALWLISAGRASDRKIDRGCWLKIVLASFALAVHFGSWIASLQYTTVGHSMFLESIHPLFAWLVAYFIFKERRDKRVWFSFLLGGIGIYFLTVDDATRGGGSWFGDALAMLAALAMAVYLSVAHGLTQRMDLRRYLVRVYLVAGFMFLPVQWFLDIAWWRINGEQAVWLMLLALGPSLIGHSLLNWAARRLPVYRVNLMLLLEAILATLYAWWLLDEKPGILFGLGALFIILAVVWMFSKKRVNISAVSVE